MDKLHKLKTYFNLIEFGAKDLPDIDFNQYTYKELEYLYDNNIINRCHLGRIYDKSISARLLLYDKCKDITDEKVLCIERDYYLKNRNLQGARVLSRRAVEYDINFLQIIPYCVVMDTGNEYVMLEKLKGDSRLLNTIDFPAGHCYSESVIDGALKELEEEINLTKDNIIDIINLDPIEICNDPFNVSYYHLGLTFMIKTKPLFEWLHNKESDKHRILIENRDAELSIDQMSKMGSWASQAYIKMKEY